MSDKWTEEELELVRVCSDLGWTAKEIGIELNRSEKSIVHKRTKLSISMQKQYSDKELLDILKNAENTGADYFMSTKGLPSVNTYQRHFGSWNNALEAAGLPLNTSSLLPNEPTTFYLIEFDGFYKIGITQNSIEKRFPRSKYDEYKVLFKRTRDFEFIRDTEKYLLAYLKDYKYRPPGFAGGFTECFKMSKNDIEYFLEKLYNIFLTAQKP